KTYLNRFEVLVVKGTGFLQEFFYFQQPKAPQSCAIFAFRLMPFFRQDLDLTYSLTNHAMLTENTGVYGYLWNKYRPVLLKLMTAAANEPQDYRLYAHEFQSLNPRQKGGYTFTLEARGGKAINNIRKSPVAMDLLQVLQQSRRAVELMEEATFELSLDKNFILHVNRREEKGAGDEGIGE